MRSSRIMDMFCKEAARAEWTPESVKPQKLKKKHRFSLTKRSTSGQPASFADPDDIPVANPRRFSRAPRLDEEYRRAQGEGPISISKGGSTAPRPSADKQLPREPVYPPDQFAVDESMAASYRRRSWTLNPRGPAGPGKPALVTIAEFEEVNEHPKSAYVPYKASTSYTSPRASTSYTPERQHDTRSPPTPPKDQPSPKATVSSPKTTGSSSAPISPPTFHPHPNPNQFIQQPARRPHSQRIFRANSRGTGVKRIPSKKQYMPKEKIISIGTGRPKIVEIIPAGRKRSWGIRNTASPPQELPVKTVPLSQELVATTASSPKKVRPAEVPAVVVGGTSPKQTHGTMPTLTITAPTPTPTPTPVLAEPTRKAPLPPAEKTVYKPYRPPTPPEPAVEKPLPSIPPLVTGWPDWKKVTDVVEDSDNVPEAVTEIQEAKKVMATPEIKKVTEIPEPLRVGPKSLSVEAKKVMAVLEAMKMIATPDEKKVGEIPEAKEVVETPGELKVEPETSSLKAKEVMAILEVMKVMAASEEKEVVVAPEVKEAIAVPEAKKVMVIPEVLRIGMRSSSLEARLGSWEALAAGERY